jgi:hypothetical protein
LHISAKHPTGARLLCIAEAIHALTLRGAAKHRGRLSGLLTEHARLRLIGLVEAASVTRCGALVETCAESGVCGLRTELSALHVTLAGAAERALTKLTAGLALSLLGGVTKKATARVLLARSTEARLRSSICLSLESKVVSGGTASEKTTSRLPGLLRTSKALRLILKHLL